MAARDRGARVFLLSGWGDEALRLNWSETELFRVLELWSQIHLCGAGLLIGDRIVTKVTATEIRIRTASGSTLAFYRRPAVDYRVAYEAHLKPSCGNYKPDAEEAHLRALEAVVNLFRSNNSGVSIDEAKAAVLSAIGRSSAKETATP